jgi:predicted DNA-binding transcriptional regulator YafY
MKSYASLITDLRDLCLLINRRTTLSNAELAERFGVSERHLYRQRRMLKALGAKQKFCYKRDGYYFDNDFHFGFGASHAPTTAVEGAHCLAALPAREMGDADFPVSLYNRLRILAQMHLLILHQTKGTVSQLRGRLGVPEKQWYYNIVTLKNLGAEIEYDKVAGHYRYLNGFWIGVRVEQEGAAAATSYLPEGGAVGQRAASYGVSARDAA